MSITKDRRSLRGIRLTLLGGSAWSGELPPRSYPPVLEEGVDVHLRENGVGIGVGGEVQGRLVTPLRPRSPWPPHGDRADGVVQVLEVRGGKAVCRPLVPPAVTTAQT
jgi:hypothetical protein